MRRLAILASVVAVAVVSANCSNSREGGSSASIMAPSAVDSSALVGTMGKGGGGGGGGKKPGGGGTSGGSSTLTLVMWTDLNGNGLPNWGDTVTFNISTTVTDAPIVQLDCYQNGVKVYWAQGAFYDSDPWPWTKYMTLQSTYWTGGAASCIATLEYQTNSGMVPITSINFDVAP